MMVGEALLDAYINANILFCVAFALWFLIRGAMSRIGLKHAYTTQLWLLNAGFLAIISAPLLVAGFGFLQGNGVAKGVNVNLSDMVVSYYLNGGFEMKASDFEGLILMRDKFIISVMSAEGAFAKAVYRNVRCRGWPWGATIGVFDLLPVAPSSGQL